MRKISKLVLISALLVLVLSISALAVKEPHAEWEFGDETNTWGIVYEWTHGEEEGSLTPYYRWSSKGNSHNRKKTGAYIKDGQEVETIIGGRLPVKYSPYIADFHNENRMLGVKVGQFVYELGPVVLKLDGAYIFSHVELPDNESWQSEGKPKPSVIFGPRRNDILLDVEADVAEMLELDFALNRYTEVTKDEETDENVFNYYYNLAAEAAVELLPGLNLTGLYAFYSQDGDWLYEVTAEYEVIPEVLTVRAGHRNSEFYTYEGEEKVAGGTWDKASVIGGPNKDDNKLRFIANTDPLKDLYTRDNSINVGATYNFSYDIVEATLNADYDTTNPKVRGDLDDNFKVSLDTYALDFNLYQELSVLVPDEKTNNEARKIHNEKELRLDYALDFYTPEYRVDAGLAEVFAQGKVNFDWDKNYLADTRSHTIASVELGAKGDLWRLEDFEVRAILAYDMPSQKEFGEGDDKYEIDPFKFAVLTKYDAPNGVKFRVEYQSSKDYANNELDWIHGDKLNARYDDIRFYDNSKFHGARVTIGFIF